MAVAVVAVSSPSLRGEDWPRWLGPADDGISSETLPATIDLEEPLWRAKIGVGFSSFAVVDGRLYTQGHNGERQPGKGEETVWCLDAQSGELIWSDRYAAPLLPNLHDGGPGATPTVHEGRLFTVSKDGLARAYDPESGTVLWQQRLPDLVGMRRVPEWGFAGSPLPFDGNIVFEAGATLALDPASGEVRWMGDAYRPAYGSPAAFEFDGKPHLAVLKTDGLVVLDAKGKTVAFEPWETSFSTNATTPIVRDEEIFVSTGYDRGCALFAFDGRRLIKRYENTTMCNHMGNSLLIDGRLYGFDGTAHRGREVEFVCLDWKSGEEVWRHRGMRYGSLTAAGDQLVVLTERGVMHLGTASPAGWTSRQEAQVLGGLCWTMPVFSGGRIYARNSRGDLVCLGAR